MRGTRLTGGYLILFSQTKNGRRVGSGNRGEFSDAIIGHAAANQVPGAPGVFRVLQHESSPAHGPRELHCSRSGAPYGQRRLVSVHSREMTGALLSHRGEGAANDWLAVAVENNAEHFGTDAVTHKVGV